MVTGEFDAVPQELADRVIVRGVFGSQALDGDLFLGSALALQRGLLSRLSRDVKRLHVILRREFTHTGIDFASLQSPMIMHDVLACTNLRMSSSSPLRQTTGHV